MLHKISENDSELKSLYRFINNVKVTETSIRNLIYEECKSSSRGKKIVVFADSTTFVFKDKRSRIQDTEGLSRIVNNSFGTFKGLICHVNLAYDFGTKRSIGLTDIRFIERDKYSRANKVEHRQRDVESIEEKESYKWIIGFEETKKVLSSSDSLILVTDREGDIIELIDRVPDEKTDIVIRSQHNRRIVQADGTATKLASVVDNLEVQGIKKIQVNSKKRKKRKAKLEIRYGKVTLPWPKDKKKTTTRKHEKGVEVYVVDIHEKNSRGHSKEKPLHWRIITTIPVENLEQALEILEIYEDRWQIEEFFKLIKTDCFDIENTELTRGRTIRKLILYVMKVGIKIQHLKAARDGEGKAKITDVFTKKEVQCLWKISPKLEGNTEKQRNPHAKNNLAFAAWVIARLGGWKEFYNPKRPPGSKTFVWGLEKFENIMFAYTTLQDVS